MGKYYTKGRKEIHGVGIEPDIWYDFNNQLKDDTKLQGFDKSIRAKRDEMIAIRANEMRYLRSNDAQKTCAADIAFKLAQGQDVPNAPQVKPAEEEHSPLLGASDAAAPQSTAKKGSK